MILILLKGLILIIVNKILVENFYIELIYFILNLNYLLIAFLFILIYFYFWQINNIDNFIYLNFNYFILIKKINYLINCNK